MRRYGRIQGLVLSLGWADFYRDVAKNWRGIGLLYVLLVIALTWIPILAKGQMAIGHFMRDELPKKLTEIPEVSIKGGKVSSPAPQPLVINDEKGDPIFILDTTGQTDFDKTKAKFLLTESKLFQRDQNRTQITDLTDFPDFTLSKENIVSWGTTASNWLGVVCFPVVVVWSLIGWLIVMLLAGAISMAANGRSKLPFGTVLRLAAVGTTLGQYFTAAAMFFSINIPYLFMYLICVGLTVAYAIFGIKCADRDRLEEFDDHDRRDDHRDDRRDDRGPQRWSSPSPPPGGPSDAFRSGPTGP